MGRPGVLQPEPEALHGIPRGTILRQGVQAQAGGGGPPGMDRLGRVAAAIGHAEPEGTVWIGDQPRLQDGEAIVGAPPLTDHLSPRPGPDMQRPQQGPRDSGARGGEAQVLAHPVPQGADHRQELPPGRSGRPNRRLGTRCKHGLGQHPRLARRRRVRFDGPRQPGPPPPQTQPAPRAPPRTDAAPHAPPLDQGHPQHHDRPTGRQRAGGPRVVLAPRAPGLHHLGAALARPSTARRLGQPRRPGRLEAAHPAAHRRAAHRDKEHHVWHGPVWHAQPDPGRTLTDPAHRLPRHAREFPTFCRGRWSSGDPLAPPAVDYQGASASNFSLPT